ncbi:MAG: acylphosphatase [Bacteroidales bacterium]|nr:acylphosphatase [Bacteroidales bacterium]
MEEKKAIIIKVFGRVQGVGFRYYAQKQAQELGIAGYVRNLRDGSVYVEVEGLEAALEQFILWCEEGPAWARVTKIEKQWIPLQDYRVFEIK